MPVAASANRTALLALVVALPAGLLPAAAQAALLLDATIGQLPFGPFTPTETIDIIGSVTNVSPDQTINICESACIGGADTFSLGGRSFVATGYSFSFGDGGDSSLGFLDGQIAGALAPGETKDFIFGKYVPDGGFAPPGIYGFSDELQIFAATSDRPMIGSSSFGGTFTVGAIPEPSSLSLSLSSMIIFLGLSIICYCRSALRSKSNH